MKNFLTVSLRQKAVFIPNTTDTNEQKQLKETTANLVVNLARLGYGVSEPLLNALNHATPTFQANLIKIFADTMGVHKNWTPLVKQWDVPTNENLTDHIITYFVNVFKGRGTTLACGHIIPPATFPLERYNGCPFCGTPFQFGKIENYGQASKLKVLELWTEENLKTFLADLLTSKTALDATQIDSLKILLIELPLPSVTISMKETLMTVIDICIERGKANQVSTFFSSPTDILRYLWYKHTGFLQIIEPKTIIKRKTKNKKNLHTSLENSAQAKLLTTQSLKLKYSRKMGIVVAQWLNNLPLDAQKCCEAMHPKRNMWVRFIRALRLAEYSKKAGFENLKALLDMFYNETYTVWQGQVNYYRLRSDTEKAMHLLKQRPGLFARSLFANMLWFGADDTLLAFAEIIDKVPARLVFTLNMYAENYFVPNSHRVVKPLGGVSKNIPANQLISLYNSTQLQKMKEGIMDLCLLAMESRFEKIGNPNKTIYIALALFKIPVSIGDRSDNVQDLPAALMGTRFAIEGNTVRLFMQWGEGLSAQHLDMDLSCHIAFENGYEICSFSNLVATGSKHSGDIRSIPEKVGTAEYIDLNINILKQNKAKYVTFTCNAYSNGEITPNLVVGFMNSKFPMTISEKTGVAYDPSCVQHQVRVTSTLTKGLVFGVLDIEKSEVVWLEMPFSGQVAQSLNAENVEILLKKLDSKLNIGNLLAIKAKAQKLKILDTPDADEVYTEEWAKNAASVTQLLVD